MDLLKRWGVEYLYKAFFLVYEWLLLDERLQVYGTVVVLDYTDITLQLMMAISSAETAKKSIVFFHKALPMRMRGVHMYNEPTFIDVFMSLVNPFLRQKIKDRFILHGQSLVKIHEDVGMEALPDEYLPDDYKGPSAGSAEKIIGAMLDDMKKPEFQEHIRDLSSGKYGVDMEKRKTDDTPAASFRKLNVS
ncbi:alpha-tocopherol transfer protein-like [Mercenaria mercenaria]|uniref:alpha-tocopherol transfer protein-like n=1 Tax=Mercenaria mercenaria TaxID=6596 RepID=UPI00234F3812|nr:alpha-tocopherol transfer protein-like [Mercenaria mercenaria]